MNNKTTNLWLKRLASKIKEANHESAARKKGNTAHITGDRFREMVQSDNSFRLGSPQRFSTGNMISSMQQANQKIDEAIPVSIPTNFNNYPHHYPRHRKPTEYYVIKDRVELGENIFDNATKKYLIKSYPCSVRISNCTFLKDISLKYINSEYSVTFINCVFESHFGVSNCTFKEFIFEKCQFKYQHTELSNQNSIKSLIFDECECKDLYIGSSKNNLITDGQLINICCNNLYLVNGNFNNFKIDNLKCNEITFLPNYANYNNQDIKLAKTTFSGLEVVLKKGNENSYLISDIDIDLLKISGTISNSLLLRNINTNEIEINNLVNDGKLRLYNISIKNNGIGKIIDSKINKAEFNNADFKTAKEFQIYLSNLSEIITTGTDFPDKIIGRTSNDFTSIRETFRQLKYAASKQGDRVKELHYEQLELSAFAKSLTGIYNWPDKFVLLTNKLSNNHGQSWLLAFVWFLVLTIPLYLLVKKDLDYSLCWGIMPRSDEIAQYLNFSVNPLHDFDKVFGGDFDKNYPIGRARLLDAISRLISGYLIFQFLRAFRKYAK